MATNYGLLGNIAGGIREAMTTYQTMQDRKRQNDMMGLVYGIQQNPDGSMGYTDQKKAEVDAQQKYDTAMRTHQLNELDPNSQESQTVAGLLHKPGISAAQGKEFMPYFESEQRAKAFSAALGSKTENEDNSKWADFAKQVNNPSSRSAFGRYQTNVDRANSLKVLERQIGMPEGQVAPDNESREDKLKRYDNASPNQLYEMANGADQLISNGNQTVYGTSHLMPKDINIDTSVLRQWAGGGPKPANAGNYIERFMDTTNREKGYFIARRDQALGGLAAGYLQLKKKDPNRWEQVLGGTSEEGGVQGLIGGQTQPSSAGLLKTGGVSVGLKPHPQDEDAVQWAKLNPKDPRAKKILQLNNVSNVGGM